MNILYYGFVREKFEIINILKEKYNWNPSFVAANETEKEKYVKNFSSKNFAEIQKLKLSDFDYLNLKKIPIGQDEFDKISSKILQFLLILKDTNNYSYSLRERLSYSRKIFNFWNTILKNIKIDCIVFYTWPHTSVCYPLYLIAKFVFKKKILFIDVVEHFDNFYHTIGTQVENLSLPYVKYINEDNNIEDVNKYIENVKQNKKYKRSDHLRLKKIYQNNYALKLLFYIFKSFFNLGFLRNSGVDWKNGKKELNYKNSMTYTEYLFFRLKLSLKISYFKFLYNSKSIKLADVKDNYIFFAAQLQPEALTTTFVGYYQDIFSILDIISSTKHDTDKIIYKEHPDTFAQGEPFYSPLYKNKTYWNEIFNYKDLNVISEKENIYETIDKSLMLVTQSSTTAIEAVIRGKPVLIFGNAWFSECEGIFKIQNYQDCVNAISKIKKGYKPDLKLVKKFLNSVAKSSYKGIIHDKFYELSVLEIKKNNIRIADLIYSKYKEYYN